VTVAGAWEDLRRELTGLRERSEDEQLHRRLREVAPALPLAERFALLHELGIYHHPESASGAGSTLAETASLRAALPDLLRSEGVRSLLDLPCGDFHWLSRVDLAGVDYTGADIVPELVAANRELYAAPGRRFLLLDATRDPLPAVDLILCRDLLIHLSLADVAAVLRNIVRSGARLLLTTHFAASRENTEIPSGDFRPINLCAAPFHLPTPRRLLAEDSALGDGRYSDRAMALWRLADLPPLAAEG
jgi:SAM-dependent methyltransferase